MLGHATLHFKLRLKTSLIIGTKCVRFKLLKTSAIPMVSPKSHKQLLALLKARDQYMTPSSQGHPQM